MTDSTDDPTSDNVHDKEDELGCKDFTKGKCDRVNCKYKHETPPTSLNFCHDFQNSFCPRLNCKFIHCSPDEVDEYKRTGEMSLQILVEATRKFQLPGVQQICIQFRRGMCRRNNCKYRHLTKEEEEAEINQLIQSNCQRNVHTQNNLQSISMIASADGPQTVNSFSHVLNDFANYGPSLPKRRLISDEQLDSTRSEPIFKGYCAGTPPAPILNSADARTIMLEEQISLLHKEISQLKRQVQDLTATNEFLLDQNAALRVSNKHNVSVPNRSLTNPTTASAQQVIGTVTAGVANVPVSIATVPVSLATVPVSLTTVTTCNRVTLSAVPSVSIAPTAQLLAPSQQILVTPSTQLAIANNSQAQLTIAASNAQQLAVANVPQQITLTNSGPQQIAISNQNQQQMLATPSQQQIALSNQNQQQLSLTNQNQQQLAIANQNQHQQQIALAGQTQHQQLTLTNQNQQQVTLTSQGQQIALASQNQPQLTLSGQNQQILTQQNMSGPQQIEIHRTIQTSQPIAMSNSGQTIVSYPIVTHSLNHPIH